MSDTKAKRKCAFIYEYISSRGKFSSRKDYKTLISYMLDGQVTRGANESKVVSIARI